MRRMTMALVLSTMLLLFQGTASAEESEQSLTPGIFGIGAGLGMRYGFFGLGLELSPVEYLAFNGGAGFAGVAAYSGGIQVFPAGRSWRVRPWLSVSAGRAILPGLGVDEEYFASYGIGAEVGFNRWNTLEIGVDAVRGEIGDFYFPTIGYKHHF